MRDQAPDGYAMAALMEGHKPLIPVLHVDDADHAEPLLEALIGAGVTILEVTLRSACALEVIERMRAMKSGAIIGAGTITRAHQLIDVQSAGAQFGVSPGLSASLSDAIASSALPFVAGVCTPTEALAARDAGIFELKLFPADLVGGQGWLRHVLPIFPELRFCPTGGTGEANLLDYLALENVFAVGGAFIASRAEIAAADWAGIATKARSAVRLVSA